MNQLLVIDRVSVRHDKFGRYCLNDIHRAAGGERRHEPSLWRNLQQTSELIQLLSDTGIPVSVIQSQPHFFKSKFSEHLRLLETVH
ncbi:KilA-N domain-containing protein [Pantoea sp. Fr-CA_6]|uniref:KilA-N domain-containing protein n=1 Tax=Pantoea sp. Fr-CA_6 TaxID=2929505 RepID=UPI002118BA5E|nr:KilA-N domain-containing protein [Pantoea sp. Fr-CA_6]